MNRIIMPLVYVRISAAVSIILPVSVFILVLANREVIISTILMMIGYGKIGARIGSILPMVIVFVIPILLLVYKTNVLL